MKITHYVGIKFSTTGKAYYFGTDNPNLKIGDKVVAESVRGLQVGEVATPVVDLSKYKSELELKPLLRIATDDDLLLAKENIKKAAEAMTIAIKEINKLGLDMRPIDVEYALDGTKLTITYVSDERVDFRELLKVLASRFHTRIELRQVGSRDKSKVVGGIGICGLPLCCSSFLNNIGGISINLAKNQMLSLNIPKLSGHCGKLICCLLYEDEAYTELRKGFPQIGSAYELNGQTYKLTSYNVLSRVVKLEGDADVQFVPLDDLKNFKKIKWEL